MPIATTLLPAKFTSDWLQSGESMRMALILGIGQVAVEGGLVALQLQKQQQSSERARAAHEGWQIVAAINTTEASTLKDVRRIMQTILEFDQMVTYRIEEDNSELPTLLKVYVGSIKSAKRVASYLEGMLQGKLLPMPQTLTQATIPLSPHNTLWGLFDVTRTQPFLQGDPRRMQNTTEAGIPVLPEDKKHSIDGISLFAELYGDFFDDGTLAQLQTNRTNYLVSTKQGS